MAAPQHVITAEPDVAAVACTDAGAARPENWQEYARALSAGRDQRGLAALPYPTQQATQEDAAALWDVVFAPLFSSGPQPGLSIMALANLAYKLCTQRSPNNLGSFLYERFAADARAAVALERARRAADASAEHDSFKNRRAAVLKVFMYLDRFYVEHLKVTILSELLPALDSE